MARAILCLGDEPPIRYAAEELGRALDAIDGGASTVSPAAGYDPSRRALWLGTFERFPGLGSPRPPGADTRFDDAIRVDVSSDQGLIAGSNPRSVLLAAYRYLHELGCRWIRPGPDGELLPRRGSPRKPVHLREAASHRHRGICIEGAVGWEHLRDLAAWMPKVGLNSYFIQFREGFTFFDRWYSRARNPLKPPELFSVEQAAELAARAVQEIKKRGLVLHMAGHGWTCEPFGVRGLGWDYPTGEPPEAMRPYLAEVAGKRAWWPGGPLNTNLCWSNPEARRIVCEAVARYASEHPEIDVVHFWLADGANNSCECAGCRATRPSDYYVMMLNEVDRILTARGVGTRIVFLAYVDLLWPPEREEIANPDRFILMFAPITRSYSRSYGELPPPTPLPPFERNKLSFPKSVEENLRFLAAWRESFPGDSFDFDYHYMWDHYNDPGYTMIARVLAEDVIHLSDIGLNGLVSCQTQRAFFPTGLGQTLMGWSLWDRGREYQSMAVDYYDAAFGEEGPAAREYLGKLTELFDPPSLRGERQGAEQVAAERLARVPALVGAFLPTIERNLDHADPCRAASWRYLKEHAAITTELGRLLELLARGRREEAKAGWQELEREVWRREATLAPVLDTWLFSQVMGAKLARKG